jgi:hypothetical protein
MCDLLRLRKSANICRVFHERSKLGIYELVVELMQVQVPTKCFLAKCRKGQLAHLKVTAIRQPIKYQQHQWGEHAMWIWQDYNYTIMQIITIMVQKNDSQVIMLHPSILSLT